MLGRWAREAATRLLIACDARQTPDRGTPSLIAELRPTPRRRVWLIAPRWAPTPPPARPLWRERLLALACLPTPSCRRAAAFAWLESGHG